MRGIDSPKELISTESKYQTVLVERRKGDVRVSSRLFESKKERLWKEGVRDLGANLVTDSGMANVAHH